MKRVLKSIFIVLAILSVSGCAQEKVQGFKSIAGLWEAGLMLPVSNDPALLNNPVAAENASFQIRVNITETGENQGELLVYDVLSAKDGSKARCFNFSASMTHELYALPFTFNAEDETLTGEITTTNEDGTSEKTTIKLIAFEMEDGSNIAMNGTIDMELFNADGSSKWVTSCVVNAFKKDLS